MIEPPLLRIGELSRRLGVSEHVLRAWERRYGLLQPIRSAGGFRLYSEADLQRIRRMQAFLSDGLSAAEAARAAVNEERSRPAAVAEPAAGRAGRLQEVVAPLPRAQQFWAHAGAPAQLADPKRRVFAHRCRQYSICTTP